jgi:hypothetical protein
MPPRIDPEIVIPTLIGLAAGLVVLPAMLFRYLEARKPREVSCPRDGRLALVSIHAGRAALGVFKDTTEEITSCTFWPGRGDCHRACAKTLPFFAPG